MSGSLFVSHQDDDDGEYEEPDEEDDADADGWLDMYLDSHESDDENYEDNSAQAVVVLGPPQLAPVARKRHSKARSTGKRIEYNNMCTKLTRLIRNHQYHNIDKFLDENGSKLTSVGRFLRSLSCSQPAYQDEAHAVRVIRRFINMPCHQKGHAVSSALIAISLHYTSTDLPMLLIDRLLRFSVPAKRVEELAKSAKIMINQQHIKFLVQWVQRTKYTLPFYFNNLWWSASIKGDLSYIFLEAARQGRLVREYLPLESMVREVLSTWSDADVVLYARYATSENQWDAGAGTIRNPPHMLHDRALYSDCLSDPKLWRRTQYCCYVNYALALGHVEPILPVYVIVWIVEWLIDPAEQVVKHISGVRLVEKVVGAHNRRRERIASMYDAKKLK